MDSEIEFLTERVKHLERSLFGMTVCFVIAVSMLIVGVALLPKLEEQIRQEQLQATGRDDGGKAALYYDSPAP